MDNYAEIKYIFFTLHSEVFKIDKQQLDFTWETYGHWSIDGGLTDLRESRVVARRRRDLQGKVLKSIIVVLKNETIKNLDDMM